MCRNIVCLAQYICQTKKRKLRVICVSVQGGCGGIRGWVAADVGADVMLVVEVVLEVVTHAVTVDGEEISVGKRGQKHTEKAAERSDSLVIGSLAERVYGQPGGGTVALTVTANAGRRSGGKLVTDFTERRTRSTGASLA